MFESRKHEVLSDNPTIKEIAGHAARFFTDDWKTSYDYNKQEPIIAKSKKLDKIIFREKEFIKILIYIQMLAEYTDSCNWEKVDERAENELKTWDGKGGFCIYISVLLWCLLYETGMFEDDQLKLIQGYYNHPTQGAIAQLIKGQPLQIGIHAWIQVDGCVMDFAIVQERSCFNFDSEPIIMGKIPEEMQLVGWEEGRNIVEEYAKEIVQESDTNYYDWIKYHNNQAEIMTRRILDGV